MSDFDSDVLLARDGRPEWSALAVYGAGNTLACNQACSNGLYVHCMLGMSFRQERTVGHDLYPRQGYGKKQECRDVRWHAFTRFGQPILRKMWLEDQHRGLNKEEHRQEGGVAEKEARQLRLNYRA